MSYFYTVEIKITNEKVYENYLKDCDEVFSRYRGKYLAVDDEYEVLEGAKEVTRMVLMEFDSKEEFQRWYFSKEYQEILKHRLQGAECTGTLIKGLGE